MKLLLINPPEKQVLRSNLPSNIESFRGNNPPIGLLYVAAAAREVEGWRIKLIDSPALDYDAAQLTEAIAQYWPDLVGIGATTFTYLDTLQTAKAAKLVNPAVKVLIGGVQPFVFPQETLRQPDVDLILAGEAEDSIGLLLKRSLENGLDDLSGSDIPGLLVKGDEANEFSAAPPIKELDELPMPAWDLSPINLYSSLVTRYKPITILITSRGCPYRCRYCANSPTGKRWRAHSADRVVEEMKTCQGLGIKYLMLYDETFTVNKERVLQVCRGILAEGLSLRWMARATPDTVDLDGLKAMRAAGCDLITIGVEAGSPEVLKRLGRRSSIEEIKRAFGLARTAGLRSIAYFMLGNPGETAGDIDQSLKLAKSLRPDMIHASLFMPYPASAIYQEALADGSIKEDYWRKFSIDPDTGFIPPYGSDIFSDRELRNKLMHFYRGFSFQPAYILRRLKDLKSWSNIANACRAVSILLLDLIRPAGCDNESSQHSLKK